MNDLITNTSLTPENAFKLDVEIKNLRHGNIIDFWKMVHKLGRMREYRGWTVLGYESWESYLAQPEISYQPKTVNNYLEAYITIYKHIKNPMVQGKFDIFNLDPVLINFDQTRAQLLAPRISDKLLEKAEHLSYSDFVKEIEALKPVIPTPPVPEGKFNVIYIDPPWQYDNSGISGAAENHYPTMSMEEMQKIEIPSDKNAVMFMWVTNPFIKEAIQLCEYWGFEYKTNMVWVKDLAGQGFYVKGQHELLFICVKGNFRPSDDLYIRSVVQEPRQEHSRKPIKFYEIIETLYPEGKYLEMFAREKRNKWTSWGNEI